MPRRWSDTLEAHRGGVRDAVLDATAELVDEHGLLSVTMSKIAEHAGIGRATVYRYFPDVEAIVVAWHERSIEHHLAHLRHVRDRLADPVERLKAVVEAYALIDHEHHGSPEHGRHLQDPLLTATLHRGAHVSRAQDQLHDMLEALIVDAVTAGAVRDDVEPRELARYCSHALQSASALPSKAAVRRLVAVTLDGLRR